MPRNIFTFLLGLLILSSCIEKLDIMMPVKNQLLKN